MERSTGGANTTLMRPMSESPTVSRGNPNAVYDPSRSIRDILSGGRAGGLSPLETTLASGINPSKTSARARFASALQAQTIAAQDREQRAATRQGEIDLAAKNARIPVEVAQIRAGSEQAVANTNAKARIEAQNLSAQAQRDVAAMTTGANKEASKNRLDATMATLKQKADESKAKGLNDAAVEFAMERFKAKVAVDKVDEKMTPEQRHQNIKDAFADVIQYMGDTAKSGSVVPAATPTQTTTPSEVQRGPEQVTPATKSLDINNDGVLSDGERTLNSLDVSLKEAKTPAEKSRYQALFSAVKAKVDAENAEIVKRKSQGYYGPGY
jgi:hypothetical protein